jgi:mono/diheme cytochrome c family protein
MQIARVKSVLAAAMLLGLGVRAEEPATPPAANQEKAAAPRPARRAQPDEPQFDTDAVNRGKELLVARCGFCHGANARGGSGGVDLTRSTLVQEDENGKQLGEFLKVGRPERNMPRFELTAQEVGDLATFLHQTIQQVSDRGRYQILDVVTGDAKAGQSYFNGKGGCAACHSPTGDLKGVGGRYEPAALQGRMLMPREGPSWGARDFAPPYLHRLAVQATVAVSDGSTVTGALVRVTDFDVTIYDPAVKGMRSWLRRDDVPRVTLKDPVQAHVDLWRRWTDRDMHDVTAFLVTLK